MSADVIPFRSQFDIDAESAVAAALFGNGDTPGNDGGRARIEARRARLGLGHRFQDRPAGFEAGETAQLGAMPDNLA